MAISPDFPRVRRAWRDSAQDRCSTGLSSGDVASDESGALKVSQTFYDYTRSYRDQIGVTIAGRHVFDMADGWGGEPPSGIDHVVVVTHRPEPEGWDSEAPFQFVDGVEAAVAKAQDLAGDRLVEVARRQGRWPGACRGSGRRGARTSYPSLRVRQAILRVGQTQHLLEDPDVVTAGNRVLHLRYRARRRPS